LKLLFSRATLLTPRFALLPLALCLGLLGRSQTAPQTDSPAAQSPAAPGQLDPAKTQKPDQESPEQAKREKAEEQIRRQEHQRVLGVVPMFNTTSIPDAVALTAKQKYALAFRSAIDPVTFLIAALDGGFGQLNNSFRSYGQGVEGFAKYWGASYTDSFDGTMLGNAFFPALLHEDPRYFRKGAGSFRSRLGYALLSTVRAKSDSGNWVPNYGNVLGNIAAGGIANLYYPSDDRGVGLTFQRAFTVTAEGAFGAIFNEFWPDVVHHYRNKHPKETNVPSPNATPPPH